MFLAFTAYLRVFIVSSKYDRSWLMQEIITVFVEPPSESLSSLVSFESR